MQVKVELGIGNLFSAYSCWQANKKNIVGLVCGGHE